MFINEELTREERKALINCKIGYGMGRILQSSYRTVDRERNLLLMKCGTYGFDVPEEIVFYFKMKNSAFLIKLTEHSRLVDHTTFSIRYSNFSILEDSHNDYDITKLKQYVKEALQVFELTGDPDPKSRIKEKVSYHFDF